MPIPMWWLSAFFVTQLVEMPIYRKALGHRTRAWLLSAVPSSLTHPIVFFVFPSIFPEAYWRGVLVAEAFAVLVEAGILSLMGVRNSVGWAILANVSSVCIGLTLRSTVGWP